VVAVGLAILALVVLRGRPDAVEEPPAEASSSSQAA
jgi:hypothetical protein